MSDIQSKIENYLEEESNDDYLPEEDIQLMDKMIDFIMSLDTENLTEDQIEEVTDLIDEISDNNIDDIFDEDEDNIDELVQAKKVKISPALKRARRRAYRKNRAAIKLKAKKFRKTTKFKQWARKKKRRASQGKTATGKRIRKFL